MVPRPGPLLYASNETQGSDPGVIRLENGALLPGNGVSSAGFTVATDDPIYVQGDYNTQDWAGTDEIAKALVAGDALSILSNAWDDANSAKSKSNRIASETTTNLVALNGIVPSGTDPGDGLSYSGGVENYFRYLEKWSGKNHIFNGSIINLWESQQATGLWGGGSIYSPPGRVWSWDTALGGISGPPGSPVTVQLLRSNWKVSNFI